MNFNLKQLEELKDKIKNRAYTPTDAIVLDLIQDCIANQLAEFLPAFEHLNEVKQQYLSVAKLGNIAFAVNEIVKLENRYYAGERTSKLFQEMMAVE